MAFLTPGMATLGGSGFSLKRGSSRYLRTAFGYPVTLYATLTDKPMYIGNGQFIQAPKTGDVVKISNLSDRRDYVGARRYIGR